MTLPRLLVPVALVLAACGDDGGGTSDAAPPDPCAPMMTFSGELVDWDSGGAGFTGVAGATMTHRADAALTGVTAPNGRYPAALMCIPATDGFVDVMPTSASGYVGGTIVVNRAALAGLPSQSFRSFTMTRAADYGFSASLAHVYVHVVGGERTVTTAAVPAVQQSYSGAAWAPGNAGTDIYLGNIAVSATTTLTVSGGSVKGPTTIPLTAGAFTYVTLIAR